MDIRQTCIIFIFLCIPLAAFGQNGSNGFMPSQKEYLWPTNAGNYLSSTFGETRSAHFHSALDLKTWGKRGYKVFATRDGTLYRMAIGPSGYGKVLYLKHDDGSYSVYAHLLRFRDDIQQLADSIRLKDYSFEMDRYVGNLNIRFKQGDLIGISGASGIGPPHLHFELRTPNHKPFNPLLTNLKYSDNIAPRFQGLSVEPLSIESEVEHSNQIYTRRARKNNKGYTFGTIDVKGTVGLGVNVFDQANEVHNAYAVYELKMYVDNHLLFHSRVDSFSYQNTGQMFIDRVYPLLKKTDVGYQRLYISEGNSLPFYKNKSSNSKLNLSPGLHHVTIEASDFYGNKSRASVKLRVQNSSVEFQSLKEKDGENKTINSDFIQWLWFDKWVNMPREQYDAITIAPLGETSNYNVIAEEDEQIRLHLAPNDETYFRMTDEKHFTMRKIIPNKVSYITSTADGSFARFESHTFYDTTHAGLLVEPFRPDSMKIEIIPDTQPTQKEFQLAISLDSLQQNMENLGIYSLNKRKQKLKYLPSRKSGTYLTANPSSLGTFYVLRDSTAPKLESPRLVQRPDGHWLVKISAEDNLSGIDHTTAKSSLNSVKGIVEYEPEDDVLVYYHPDFVPQAENKFTLSVRDMMGNYSEVNFLLKK